MRASRTLGLGLTVSLLVANVVSADSKSAPRLVPAATYDTGLGGSGAEIISVRHRDGIAVLTNVAGSVDVLDLSNPFQPQLLYRLAVDTSVGTPNSVALHPHRDYFLVVVGAAGVLGRVDAYRLADGALLASARVGIQPDSIAIAPNGRHAVIANEAEGVGTGQDGGSGSITLVDLRHFKGTEPSELPVDTILLPSQAGTPGFSTGRTDDLARLPVDNTPPTLEPETVAFSHDSRFAYVTLQENSGVVRVDVPSGHLTFLGLGQTTHAADLTANGVYQPFEMLTAFREPDGIAVDRTGKFFVTADEGDTRDARGNSGPRGGRTVSVFDTDSGAWLGDTGSQIDDAAAAAGLYPDSRSNRGGSEPEVLDLTRYRGRTLVAVGLERANSVALIDVSDPLAPAVLDVEPAGVGPEGIKFFRVGPRLFLAVANEVSGTVTLLEVVF